MDIWLVAFLEVCLLAGYLKGFTRFVLDLVAYPLAWAASGWVGWALGSRLAESLRVLELMPGAQGSGAAGMTRDQLQTWAAAASLPAWLKTPVQQEALRVPQGALVAADVLMSAAMARALVALILTLLFFGLLVWVIRRLGRGLHTVAVRGAAAGWNRAGGALGGLMAGMYAVGFFWHQLGLALAGAPAPRAAAGMTDSMVGMFLGRVYGMGGFWLGPLLAGAAFALVVAIVWVGRSDPEAAPQPLWEDRLAG